MNGPTSGQKYVDTIDLDSPEYLREQYRPAEVKQDVRQMVERKRVNEILKSKQFREELEDVVVDKIKSTTPDTASIIALQQISDLILPQAKLKHGPVYGRGLNAITPISDYSADNSANFEKGERQLRCKLAACYRLIHQYHWNQPKSHTYISACLGYDPLSFLISPGDIPFANLCASDLIKLNEEGRTTSGKGGVDDIASIIHAATYLAREGARSAILIRSSTAVLLASTGSGLLPLGRDAVTLGRVPLVELRNEEDVANQLATAFQEADRAILIKGIGALVVGDSIEEAFIAGRKLVGAMEAQLKVSHVGLENLFLLSEEAQRRAFRSAGKKKDALEFEALMRHLENAGHCTGYPFRKSLFWRAERSDKVNAEIELPPAVVTVGYQDDDRPRERKLAAFAEYLNSPNVYKREELDSAEGTPYHKKITRWVQETSPAGHLIKIDSPNQFAPVGADTKELKATMRKICREYYDENITAGPQSKILGGLTWDEAQQLKDKNTASDTVIVVGSSSRGIIQKGHQNQGSLYRTYYAPNPFSDVTDDDVDAYKMEIGMKASGDSAHIVRYSNEDPDSLVPGPDGHLISTEERLKQVKQQKVTAVPGTGTEVDEVVSDNGEEDALKKIELDQQQHPATHRGGPQSISIVQSHVTKDHGRLPTSPAKSMSSGEGTAPEVLSGTEKSEFESGVDEKQKKKKKKGFRMPSFSKKKDTK